MVPTRRARWALPFFVASSLVACNALLDNEADRQLDARSDGGLRDRETADDTTVEPSGKEDVEAPGDAGVDARRVIDVPLSFITPNGAQFQSTDAGTTITGYTQANHPVIVPVQQPAIDADDYTVEATVFTPTAGEFGLMTRVQEDGGAGYVLGSMFGQEAKPFIGLMGPPSWGPSLDSAGPKYTFTTNHRYFLKLSCEGSTIRGKIWKETEPEPDWQTGIFSASLKTGRGIGFYVYFLYDAVLERLRITVP